MKFEKIHLLKPLYRFIDSCHLIQSQNFNKFVPQSIGYPEATPELIIILEGSLEVIYNNKSYYIDKSCFFTFIDKPIIVNPSSNIKIIKVLFKAQGVFPLVKLTHFSAKELISIPFLLCEDVFYRKISLLEASLQKTQSIAEIEKLLSFFLVKEFEKSPLTLKDIIILEMIESNHFNNVHDLCNQLNIEIRTLQRWANLNLGISIKFFLRLRRFKYLLKDLTIFGDPDYIGLAVRNNFYDQNHMIKETRFFSDQTPSRILLDKYFPTQISLIKE